MKNVLPLDSVSCLYGAQLGMANTISDTNGAHKFHLYALEWFDSDYISNGTYWGNNSGFVEDKRIYGGQCWRNVHIYRAISGNHADNKQEMFIRAESRADAKQKVLETFPNAWFYR